MASNPRRDEEQSNLQDRLKSLRIEREPAGPPEVRHSPPKKLLLALSVVVALAAAAYYYFSSSPETVSAAEVIIAGQSAGNRTALTVSGYVVAHHKIEVGSKVMGRVQWIGVEKGDKVKKGQVLVRLEDTEFRAQVNQARANLAAAEARLDQLRAGSRPQEKLRDRAAVIQAEATLKNAQAEYNRIEKLTEAGVASKADLDRVTAQRDSAKALLEAARQSSNLTDVGPRVEEVRAAEAEARQMKASLDYALTQLDSTEIRAPVSGTVLQRIVETGEMVTPSAFGESGARTSVVALADLNDLQVEIDISQTDFARLKMGQRAEIIPESFPNLRYGGFIEEIAPEANRAKATVQVKVKVENPDEQLRPEMNARVNFFADSGPEDAQAVNQVLVPKGAVVRKDATTFVFVIRGSRATMRTVRLGDEAGDFYQVLDGLGGGETVVTAGADRLRDGDRVKIAGSSK